MIHSIVKPHMIKKKLTLNILLFLVLTDVLETMTQFCFKKSALSVGTFTVSGPVDILAFMRMFSQTGYLWVGICFVVLTFVIWSSVLSKIDLSVAVPIASSSYILVPIVSVIFLHEKITPLRWVGILFILAGVISVSLSTKDKEIMP